MADLGKRLTSAKIDFVWFENNLDLIRSDMCACGIDPRMASVEEWICSAKFVYALRNDKLFL